MPSEPMEITASNVMRLLLFCSEGAFDFTENKKLMEIYNKIEKEILSLTLDDIKASNELFDLLTQFTTFYGEEFFEWLCEREYISLKLK